MNAGEMLCHEQRAFGEETFGEEFPDIFVSKRLSWSGT